MKVLSWNLNGLKSCIKKGFIQFVKSENADIICCQETRTDKVSLDLLGYKFYWNISNKSGYAGLLVATKQRPLNIMYGVNNDECDKEGRCTTLEFREFFLVNTYVPNCRNNSLERYYFRQDFDEYLYEHIKELKQHKPVVLCGDFNVAHRFLDLNAESERNLENPPGFLTDDRENFERILDLGFVDAYRFLYPNKRAYTWYGCYKHKERTINVGSRIDYFLVSDLFKNKISDVIIFDEVKCSDHCPVELIIDIEL